MLKNKLMYVAIAFFLLVGCSSSPKVETPSVTADAQYTVKDFAFNLTQKRNVDGYPEQEELSSAVYEQIISELNAAKLLSESAANNTVPISITINYQRRFAGEDTPFPSKSVANPIVSYTIVVFEKGAEKGRISKSGLTVNKGFLSNLKTVATMGAGNNAQTEVVDIQRVANTIVNELQKLRR